MQAFVNFLFFLFFVAVACGVGLAIIYNQLVRLRQEVKNSWAQIDVQLKRRHDLIPNLVNIVKGYAAHEKGTFEAVANARAKAAGATHPADRFKAEDELTNALGRLMAVSEAYPNLKANENFLGLQNELANTENRIAFSRQAYNNTVTQLNTSIQSFPAVLLADYLGFKAGLFFESSVEDKQLPTVKF
jgi:LemA protein